MSDRTGAPDTSSDAYNFKIPLPADANKEIKAEFADYHAKGILANPKYDTFDTWEIYAEQFQHFNLEAFQSLPAGTKTDLRQVLRSKGVYVNKGRGQNRGRALLQALEEGLDWPSGEARDGNGNEDVQLPPPQASQTPKGKEPLALATPSGSTDAREPPPPPPQKPQPLRELSAEEKSHFATIGRLTTSLAKIYTSEDKYGGDTEENLETKLKIFGARCKACGLVDTRDLPDAVQFMLKDQALEYYLEHCHGQGLGMEAIEAMLRDRFYTEERTMALVREWERASLKDLMTKNPGKSPRECLDELVARLYKLRATLPARYRDEETLRDKLVNATMGVKACAAARSKPSKTARGLISELQSSIAEWECEQGSAEALYTDRRYNGTLGGNVGQNSLRMPRNPRPSRQPAFPQKPPVPRYALPASQEKSDKRCFVCGRQGCWSTNHGSRERHDRARQLIADIQEESGRAIEEAFYSLIDIDAADPPVSPPSPPQEDNSPPAKPPDDLPSAFLNSIFLSHLNDSAALYALTGHVARPARYGKEAFHGILVDTGANKLSTAGQAQYQAYCAVFGLNPTLAPSDSSCSFGVGSASALGSAEVPFPVGSMVLKATFHIVDADVPFLLCLADMDRLGVYYDNIDDQLIHKGSGHFAQIQRVYGHPFVQWDPVAECLLTETELRRLHRRFGHPSAEKLSALLRQTDHKADNETRQTLEAISRECELCQRNAQAPRRFKFALHDDKQFNSTIYVDVLYINGRPVLHVVDEATNYQAARWLPNVAADTIWQALRLCWIDVYVGPPDVIAHDAGKGFIAGQFQASADMLHITTKGIPVESPQSMATVERYHAPLRRAYNIIAADSPQNTDPALTLQAAVKACNDSVGPNGLIPTLLVFGAIPRLGLPNDLPAPATFKRAAAVRKATEELTRATAKARVSDALNARNGPIQQSLQPGMEILVWRQNARNPSGSWQGPFKLVDIQEETCSVLLPSGPTPFRSTAIRPFVRNMQGTEHVERLENDDANPPTEAAAGPSSNPQGLTPVPATVDNAAAYLCVSATAKAFLRDTVEDNPERFREARNREIQGLLDRGTFEVVPTTDADSHRTYGGRFVDEIKNAGTPHAYEKSRFVVQAFNDRNHGLLTHAPTVQRASQRICLAMCVQDPSFRFFCRDVSQAYLQSETSIQQQIYVRPPPELGLDQGHLLRVARPLYGIPEAGVHWFSTYHRHHTKNLAMTPAAYDPCLLYSPGAMNEHKSGPRGITCLQTDDTANAGNEAFVKLEERASRRFQCKPKEILAPGNPIRFNGATVTCQANGTIRVHQDEQISRVRKVNKGDKAVTSPKG